MRLPMFHYLILGHLCLSLCLFASSSPAWSESELKPNIIFILADDLGYHDVGFNGQQIIQTPELDRMRQEGMNFTNHYSGATVCAPSRSVLMTGLHTGNTTIRSNRIAKLKPEDITVAEILKPAGYTTGIVGKWGIGRPSSQGFDYFYGYVNQVKAHAYYPEYIWRNDEKIPLPNNPTERHTYIHDEFTREALEFVERNQDGPFFLYLPYTIPHADLDVPSDSMEPYSHIEEPRPFKGNNYIANPTPRRAYAGMVSRMDRDIGQLLQKLRDLGIDQNTLVIFSSDNGAAKAGGADPKFFQVKNAFRGFKRDLYEGGIRVPCVAWWPGVIEPNSTSDHISAFWDFMPTCADLASVQAPKTDGISFLPTLRGESKDQSAHEYLYWEFHDKGSKQAIRSGNWKGLRVGIEQDPTTPLELYNLEIDPQEKTNLASKHPEIATKLSGLLDSVRTAQEMNEYSGKSRGSKPRKKKKQK